MESYKKQLIGIYKPFWRETLLILTLIFISSGLRSAMPYFFGKVISVATSGDNYEKIVFYGFIGFALGIGTLLVVSAKGWFEIYYFNHKIKRGIARASFDKVMSLSIGQHINENSGVKRSVIASGDNNLQKFLHLVFYEVFPILIHVFMLISALFWLDLWLGGFVLISVALFCFFLLKTGKKVKDVKESLEEAKIEKEREYDEILRNTSLVLLNAKGCRAKRKYFSFFDKWVKKNQNFEAKKIKFRTINEGLGEFSVFLSIAIGALFVVNGTFDAGTLITFIFWSSNVFVKMSNIGRLHDDWLDMSASIKKYFDMMEVESDILVDKNLPEKESFLGDIELQNVSFSYPYRKSADDGQIISEPKKEIISNISLSIKAGEKVAIVGQSGSGKSTLINLLTRAFDPSSGEVLIDDIDLKETHLDSYRKKLGVVEQDVSLFDESLEYNITFGVDGVNSEFLEQRLQSATEVSRVSEFLPDLEHGLDTIIGERGVKLSGGQRQRVGIARALIKNPTFLIFDEATSSLDAYNEFEIHKSINEAAKNRTTIIIAHRLSTIKNVDKIFVIDKGKLVGQGQHSELVKNCPQYENLVQHQYL